jgi:anaerobic selenocysteine-containing dehydrogenase
VCKLAQATLGNKTQTSWPLFQQHYDNVRNAIEKTIAGFDNYNERVREPGGFYLPNGSREGKFNTFSGKANFNVAQVTFNKLADDELLMMTIRTHDQFNTTIYGLDDRYRGIYNERRVVLMNEKDISKLGYQVGDVVDLYNYHDGVERVAHKFMIVAYNIPEQCCATYFPETNVLVPINSVADKSNTPTSKYVVLKLKKHAL